jgi:hypothetical protein
MAEWYTLWNTTKRECLVFTHVGASTARELAGNPAASAITTWYLLKHPGDHILFAPFGEVPEILRSADVNAQSFPDRTDEVIDSLIANKILKDFGFTFQDDDERDSVYVRDLRNVWMSQGVQDLPGDADDA